VVPLENSHKYKNSAEKIGADASARRKMHKKWPERIEESKDGQPSVVVNWSDHSLPL
jgi:hypothetical protein